PPPLNSPRSPARTSAPPWRNSPTADPGGPASEAVGPEVDTVARPELGEEREIGGGDDGDDGIAAGGRVIGEEDDRLAVGRHLDRPGHHALAGQLPVPGARQGPAAQPYPHPVAVLGHLVRLAAQRLQGVRGEPVVS